MLELAAIATVGDVMKLKDENRIVVKEGLKKLANTKIQGLVSLMEKNTLDPEHISAYHVGFVLGPCLNASGRLKRPRWLWNCFWQKIRPRQMNWQMR